MFGRLKQSIQEKRGAVARTSYDADFENSAQMMDDMKQRTEDLLDQMRRLLECYGGAGTKLSRLEGLAQAADTYAQRLPPGSRFKATLEHMKAGEEQANVSERQFIRCAEDRSLTPMRTWIKTDYQNFVKSRDLLKKKRLDMDGLQNKAKTGGADQARVQQAVDEHQTQFQTVQALLAQIPQIQETHRACVKSFLELQLTHYKGAVRALEAAFAKC